MMKKMNDCVNIVNCEDLKYEAKEKGLGFNVYIKMELLTPLVKSLPEIITDDIVIKLAKDMCNALNVCKEYGVIHRDIKPQNIFVSKYGDYKLGDFCIAKTVEKTMGGTKIGTYKYMAPEVYNNQPYGSSADIYSLGLVLYWMLNERRMPFMPLPPEKPRVGMEEESRQRRFSGEPLPPPLNGSDELKRIVLKACAYNCADRYKDAREMLNDLLMLTNYYSNGSAGFAAAPVSSTGFAEYDEGTILSETINSFGEDVGLQYSVNPPVNVNNALGDDEGTALLSEDTSVLENVEMQYIAMPQIQENIPVMMTPPPSPV
jgi:serine/threonine protein kinase